ncbi:hypothetical protein MASR1M45_22940 [Candidatus Kapaibacterium sp.]
MLYAQEDPNVMWTYKDASFTTYPAVHPNGNVLIGDGNKGDVIELNGLTGELVRRIPLPAPDLDPSLIAISKDGSKMAASGYIIDVETGAVITAHPRAAAVRFLHPSNSKVIYTLFNQKDTSWVVWDMENDTYKNYQIPYLVTTIEVSSDGRFLAVASKETSLPINDQRTHFYLYDAQTMQLIRELENVPAEGRTIEFIQFSENAKYVGYGQLTGGKPKATFFTCLPPYKKWEINKSNQPPYGMRSIGFIKDAHALFCTNDYTFIWDINKELQIYQTSNYISYNPLYNTINNSIIIWDKTSPTLASLDFNKILNSVSINEPNDPIQKFITEYRKGILKISGIESILPIINLTINDIKGNIVFQNGINHIKDIIEIPVQLQNGVYLLHIQDGNKSHTAKFLVLE